MSLVAAIAPDPGQPGFGASTALFFGLAVTALALARRHDRETVRWFAFIGAFLGGVIGFLVYLFGLLTDLY